MSKREIGLVGLGVMGENLALNIADKGFSVAVYNRTAEKTRRFAERLHRDMEILPTYSTSEFLESLDVPRRILLMVTAGTAVDLTINQLTPKLTQGDLLIDGGNSFFRDTIRRTEEMEKKGFAYLGVGVSGGEEGALNGPCIMVGGSRNGYDMVKPVLTKIAAQVKDGACCAYLGPGGAGHFTKMVHNGIEYAVMQLIAEAYDIQSTGLGLEIEEIREVFAEWSGSELNSYLMEITTEVLGKVDKDTGKPLVKLILDRAGQKGTGKWTSQAALDLGIPIPSIDAAVSARNLSGNKEMRIRVSQTLGPPKKVSDAIREEVVKSLRDATFSSILISYVQGIILLRAASEEYGYAIPIDTVTRIWKGGCIIRAKLLDLIYASYKRDSGLPSLLLDKEFTGVFREREKNWRWLLQTTRSLAIPCPAMNASLDYFDSSRRVTLPTNLIQALRDYFGSHTYERVDKSGSFHTDWSSR